MKKITREVRAAEAYQRSTEDYNQNDENYQKLLALGPNPLPDQVDQVMGSSWWTAVKCEQCGLKVDSVIEFFVQYDDDTNEFWVCRECLTKALQVLTTDSP